MTFDASKHLIKVQGKQDYLCECGCGAPVAWRDNRPNRFIVGHAMKGRRLEPQHRERISVALKEYAASPSSHLHELRTSGSDHPNWRGGSAPSYYRRVALATYGNECRSCGSVDNIDVHHRDGNRYNSDPANIVPLCRGCHLRVHRGGMEVQHV